jgi:hypothetical protein
MRNSDLIAFLKPLPNQFTQAGSIEFLDISGQVTDIRVNPYRLSICLKVSAGLYRVGFETVVGAFDWSTAMITMVRVPDGQKVKVGPWDLDHIHNVMAVPMIRTLVNGDLKGGLWCAMPGPEQIAEGRLSAEFGFEAREGDNELTLEIIERDRERLNWGKIAHFALRADDRRTIPLEPQGAVHPRIFLYSDEVSLVREKWRGHREFETLQVQLHTEELTPLSDNSQGTLALACLMYALTDDDLIGARAKSQIMALVSARTWSGRPDPLLMGGDNDRGISLRLYHAALAWDYLQPLFDEEDRCAILSKVEEYLHKIYDFTLLQRSYMGCPAIDPHSLGSWNGAAIACMAFYEELAVARQALPFFHGLFCDSLKLFPASGKAAWATYFPFHLVLYLAAAHTFGGRRPELAESPFLDNLGRALMASFEVPNSQELQRGLRTREHRFLTAFLCRFHPARGIDDIYRAFVEKERKAAGDVTMGVFDLLYAPALSGPVASFPDRPLFAKDVGDLNAIAQGEPKIAVSVSGGPKAGRLASFALKPHNREFAPSLGALEVSIDGTPVLCNVNMGVYGLNSALTNTMCFEDGGALTNGQYLNGDIPPDACAIIRRCLIGERWVYAHIVVTNALEPGLRVNRADRIFIFDRQSGGIVLADCFQGEKAIRFATHLHCSGSVQDLGNQVFRLTGGQANLIAGIKHGSKGLDNNERGEVFVHVLGSGQRSDVVVEEPGWVPAYIYGLNNTGQENISEGRFPHYQRWRLASEKPGKQGSFLLAISPKPESVHYVDEEIHFPEGGCVRFGLNTLQALGVEAECECLLSDEATQCVTALGLQSMRHGERELAFQASVDLEYNPSSGKGVIFAQQTQQPRLVRGFDIMPWTLVREEGWRTHNNNCAFFEPTKHVGRRVNEQR